MNAASPGGNPYSDVIRQDAARELPRLRELGLRFQRDGFVIARDVFTRAEVERLRRGVYEYAMAAKAKGWLLEPAAGEVCPCGDLLGQPELAWVLSDPRVGAIARALIGRDDLVYFGDSSVMLGGSGRGFHKDNTVRDDATHPDWLTPYSLVRMALYLEDHERHSGGLKVRRGSHLFADVSSGDIVDVPTRAGDIVIWSLRTTHSGHAMRVRGLPFLRLAPRYEARLPEALRTPEDGVRHALFFTFGTNDEHLRNYVTKHSNLDSYPENYLYKSWLHSYGGEDAARRLSAAGVKHLKPVADYGRCFGSDVRYDGGFVPTRPWRPDVYPIGAVEKMIRFTGRAVRALGARFKQ
jgi:hypothetical protein